MAKNKEKEFNTKLYAVMAIIVTVVILLVLTVMTYRSRYIGFDAGKTAVAYVDTIAQTGDGYNAYKFSLVSFEKKYGDFIRDKYIYPVTGKDSKDSNILCADSQKGEKTLNDDGKLQGELNKAMLPYYNELTKNGWDNYDKIFTDYMQKLLVERENIYGDKFMNDEVFFTTLEANVSEHGKTLTGTEDAFDENTGAQTSFKTIGTYQTLYGENYTITTEADDRSLMSVDDYKQTVSKEFLDSCGVNADKIKAVSSVNVIVRANGNVIGSVGVVAVQIGSTWYVDNTETNTEDLYKF